MSLRAQTTARVLSRGKQLLENRVTRAGTRTHAISTTRRHLTTHRSTHTPRSAFTTTQNLPTSTTIPPAPRFYTTPRACETMAQFKHMLATSKKLFSTLAPSTKDTALATTAATTPEFTIPSLNISEQPVKPSRLKKYLRRFAKTTVFLCISMLIASQVSAYPILCDPVATSLQLESVGLLGAAFEQMAPLGLLEMKLLPLRVVEQMADPKNLTFDHDPTTIIEKPELGHLINSAAVLKGETKSSYLALPHLFDPVNEAEQDPNTPVKSFIHRTALRNQYVNFIGDCFKLYHEGLAALFFHSQSLMMAISMIQPEQLSWVYTFNPDMSPIKSLERVVDMLFLRTNSLSTKLSVLTHYHPVEAFSLDPAYQSDPTTGQHPQQRQLQLGNDLQHYMLDQTSAVGTMLRNADNEYIHTVLLPDPESEFVQKHPFKDELLNIPEEVKNHPDRTITGPLFEYYYNIFSRNAYNNMLTEENKYLAHYRDTILTMFGSFDIAITQGPLHPISGSASEDLQEDISLQRYLPFIKDSVTHRVEQYNIQTPLYPQPFHYFQSTGVLVEDLPQEVALRRRFPDIMPRNYSIKEFPLFREYWAPEESAAALERYAALPRMGPEVAVRVDTNSLTRLALDDVPSLEWDFFNKLPPRYVMNPPAPGSFLEPFFHPQLADDVGRVLTKLDATILRNQFEMERVQQVAFNNNPSMKKMYDEFALARDFVAKGGNLKDLAQYGGHMSLDDVNAMSAANAASSADQQDSTWLGSIKFW